MYGVIGDDSYSSFVNACVHTVIGFFSFMLELLNSNHLIYDEAFFRIR